MEQNNEVPEYNVADVVGMELEDAYVHIAKGNYTSRIVEKDGAHFIITMDFRMTRLNLVVNDGVVTKYSMG